MIAVPMPRPVPTTRPDYDYFQAVRTSVVERVADYFGKLDGNSQSLSRQEASSAANYLRQWSDYFQNDQYKSYVYNTYATVFDNLALALKAKDPAIDTGSFRPFNINSSFRNNPYAPDGQLFLGSSSNRANSELRALANQRGAGDVLSYQDFFYAKARRFPVFQPLLAETASAPASRDLALGEDA